MYRTRVALLLTIAYVLAPRLHGREWTDTTGKHSIEAAFVSCNVVLRLPTGETKTIDLDMLSQDDREYIAEVLTRTKVANGSGNDKAAERAKPGTAANEQHVPIDTLLLEEEREWQDVANTTSRADGFFSFEHQLTHATDKFHHYQQTLKSLSELAPQDKRIASAFTERLMLLRNAPTPYDRVEAALRLSGAEKIADQTVPALLQALEKDVSSQVQLAATVSLAGYGPAAKGVIPTLVKRIDSGDPTGIYLFALVKIGGDSPQVRKIIKKPLDAYRAPNNDNSRIDRVTQSIVLFGQNSNWAVAPLLQDAEVAIRRGDNDALKTITDALVSVASGDVRVLKFYETQAKEGPIQQRVYCDSIAKQLRLNAKQ